MTRKPSEGVTSAQAINAAIDVRELSGEEAAEAISDFAGLSLEPIPSNAEREKLREAGFGNKTAWTAVSEQLKGRA